MTDDADTTAEEASDPTPTLADVAGIGALTPRAPDGLLAQRLRVPFFPAFVGLALLAHAAALAVVMGRERPEGGGGRFADASALQAIETDIIDASELDKPGGDARMAMTEQAPVVASTAVDGEPEAAAVKAVAPPPVAQVQPPELAPPEPAPTAAVQTAVLAVDKAPDAEAAPPPPKEPPPDGPPPPVVQTPPDPSDRPNEPPTVAAAVPTPVPAPAPVPSPDEQQAPPPPTAAAEPAPSRIESAAEAAMPRPGAGGQAAASKGEVDGYHARLGSRLKRYKPLSYGRKGVVVISFSVEPDGGLTEARVARSSGDGFLDGKALAAVRRAAPYPLPPAGMSGKQREFTVPFTFE